MNRIVLITGATRGIGFETAKKFLSNGDKVIVASIDKPEIIEKSMAELKQLGEAIFVECNIAKLEDCQHVVEKAKSEFGKIDILVNVAGVVGQRISFLDADLSDIENTIKPSFRTCLKHYQSLDSDRLL